MLRPWLALSLTLAPLPILAQQLQPNDLVFEQPVTGLQFPTAAEFLPDGRMVIIQQNGGVRVRPANGGALVNAGTIPIHTGVPSERGLLGLAIDPQFSTSRRLYFYYSDPSGNEDDRHRVSWAELDPVTNTINVGSLANNVIVSGLYGPANHNGGGLAFGPDGNLYIGVGDTGCNCSCAPGTADNYFPTCLTNLNGKILRVDRDGNVPAGNPLQATDMVPACGGTARPCADGPNVVPSPNVLGAARPQIYNWGFRNPWRFSFDKATGYLWIGDVGEVTWEEITISTGPGQHHGWPFREGTQGDPVSSCAQSTPQSGDCKEPAYAYRHAEFGGGSGSVTGGVFSDHCAWPAPYQGRYWFADYTSDVRRVWTLTPNGARDGVEPNSRTDILTNADGVVHFFVGPEGWIYMANVIAGEIWRIGPQNPAACPDAGVSPDAAPQPEDVGPGMDAAPGLDGAPAADATGGPDAGASADAASAADGGGVGADGGAVGADEGCGCGGVRATRGLTFGAAAAWLALGLGVALARRRRR